MVYPHRALDARYSSSGTRRGGCMQPRKGPPADLNGRQYHGTTRYYSKKNAQTKTGGSLVGGALPLASLVADLKHGGGSWPRPLKPNAEYNSPTLFVQRRKKSKLRRRLAPLVTEPSVWPPLVFYYYYYGKNIQHLLL